MIRSALLALVMAASVMAQVPVPEVPGLPPEIAAQLRKDVEQINQLGKPFPQLPLAVFPAGPGSFSSTTSSSQTDEWSMVNDKFRLKFSDNETVVKVCGKVVEGKAVLDEIVMVEGKAAEKAVAKLEEMPVSARKRLVELLEQKLAR